MKNSGILFFKNKSKIFFAFTLISTILFTGCSDVEPQTPKKKSSYEKKKSKKIVRKRKKAPKRVAKKKKVYKKAKKKYEDTSVSSQVRRYDPIAKKRIYEKKNIIIPSSAGGKLFHKKSCTMCHKEKITRIGPSLKTIAKAYKGDQKALILYLQRKSKAKLHNDRASIMKSQLTKLRILSEQQYKDISSYILSIN